MGRIQVYSLSPSGYYDKAIGKEKPAWPGKVSAKFGDSDMTYFGDQDTVFLANRPVILENYGLLETIGVPEPDLGMTDKMMGDMLATPVLANRSQPPRVIIDSEYFRNESSSRINKNRIATSIGPISVFSYKHSSNV